MKFNAQMLVNVSLLVTICFLFSYTNAASVEAINQQQQPSLNHHLNKRSPYLRLDELSTKIYLAKNKLGGGLIDPLEIGKRSSSSNDDSEMELAVVLYDGFVECINRDKCSRALKILLDN